MEVPLTAEQEAQIAQIASASGTQPERLAQNVLSHYLEVEARFRDAVFEGIAQADRDELIDEAEMARRLEQMLHS
jgi:predicted transcriptional regulator